MKYAFPILLLCLLFYHGDAQTFCDDLKFDLPTIEDCTGKLRSDVAVFNKMASYYGIKDTIRYTCSGKEVTYYYKNEIRTDFDYDPTLCGKKLMLRGFHNSFNFKLLASIPTKDNKAIVYEVIQPEKESKRLVYKQYQEEGILPYGKYTERNCSGQIVTQGQYAIIDTPSSYSFYWYDGAQRKSVTKVIESDRSSVRTGQWKFYDDTGALLSTQYYPNKKSNKVDYAEECCNDPEKDVVWDYYSAEKVSFAIDMYNHVNAMLGRKDNMSVDITHRGLVYYKNGELIDSPFYDMEEKYKDWEHQLKNTNKAFLIEYAKGTLNVYTATDKGKGEWMKFSNKTLDMFQVTNKKIDGRFERYNCHGQKIIEGNLMTIDTLYTIKEKSFSYETYQEEVVETEITHETQRIGQWSYYNNSGDLVATENYQGATEGTLYKALLCATKKEEATELSQNIPNTFLLFNSICKILKLDHWVTDERILADKGYYYNGKKVRYVDFMPKPNRVDAYRFYIPEMSIEIEKKTNDHGALGKLEDNLTINFKASVSHSDGRMDELYFNNGRIKLIQTFKRQLGGRYEERACDGRLLLDGQYCQIDSFHIDTAVYFNPETYEEVIKVTESDVYSKKSGVWRHYDNEGVLVKEEDFGICKD